MRATTLPASACAPEWSIGRLATRLPRRPEEREVGVRRSLGWWRSCALSPTRASTNGQGASRPRSSASGTSVSSSDNPKPTTGRGTSNRCREANLSRGGQLGQDRLVLRPARLIQQHPDCVSVRRVEGCDRYRWCQQVTQPSSPDRVGLGKFHGSAGRGRLQAEAARDDRRGPCHDRSAIERCHAPAAVLEAEEETGAVLRPDRAPGSRRAVARPARWFPIPFRGRGHEPRPKAGQRQQR